MKKTKLEPKIHMNSDLVSSQTCTRKNTNPENSITKTQTQKK